MELFFWLWLTVLLHLAVFHLFVFSSGGRIDPNIDNIDTNVGNDIDRYQCNEIDTLVSVSLLYALLWFYQRGDLAVRVCVSAAAFKYCSCHSAKQAHFAPPPPHTCVLILYFHVTLCCWLSLLAWLFAWRHSRAVWLYFQAENETTWSCIVCETAVRYSGYTAIIYKHIKSPASETNELQKRTEEKRNPPTPGPDRPPP